MYIDEITIHAEGRTMKKVVIVLLLFVWSVSGLANPIVPQLFSELYFDSTGWKIEVVGQWISENYDRIVIISSTDSAETDTSFHLLGDFPVITSADMETTLYINPNGDHLRIGIHSEYGLYFFNDFIFGENGVIAAPRSGESIAFGGTIEASEYEYYLDDTPTLGAMNDYENSKGTIRGIVTDSSGTPIPEVTVKYSFIDLSQTITTDANGQFECKCPTGRLNFTFRHDNYEFLGVPVQIWPDSVLEKAFILTAYPHNYQTYFPLQVGNHWGYQKYINDVYSTYESIDITDTVSINEMIYYIMGSDTVRYDSLKNIVIYKNQHDSLLYALSLTHGDSMYVTPDSLWMAKLTYSQTSITVEAGTFTDNIIFSDNFMGDIVAIFTIPEKQTYFSKNVGLVKSYQREKTGTVTTYELYYAYVNGTTYYHYNHIAPATIPAQYKLSISNYPNPFNSSTTLKYHLPETGDVRLSVFDLSGRLVEELFCGRQAAGDYHYLWSDKNLPSGVYFLSLQSGNQRIIQKCMLMK